MSWAPRWNIAPTQKVLVVRQDRKEPKRSFALLRWGLIPFWAKDPSIGFETIRAMSETGAEKPAFRDAMKLPRCLIPADGFYEWEKLGTKVKQPYSFGLAVKAEQSNIRLLFAYSASPEPPLMSTGAMWKESKLLRR